MVATFEIRNFYGGSKWFIYYFRVECNELVGGGGCPGVAESEPKTKKIGTGEHRTGDRWNYEIHSDWLPTMPFCLQSRFLSGFVRVIFMFFLSLVFVTKWNSEWASVYLYYVSEGGFNARHTAVSILDKTW